ncbi:addiction module protein [Janibacter limosus]|uniref:addiction module protein n=1 Tax=Janibacter limosus TaxID=53458 RepID=UPI0035DB9985
MSVSESQFYEAGMSLPPDVRRHVALRLLESLEDSEDESVDDEWTIEISRRVDDLTGGRLRTVPSDRCLRGHRCPPGCPQRMTLPVRFHPDARDEFIAEVDWYDDRAGLGERFAEAVEIAIEFAAEDPEAWPPLQGWPREPIVRSKGVTSFPYPSPVPGAGRRADRGRRRPHQTTPRLLEGPGACLTPATRG